MRLTDMQKRYVWLAGSYPALLLMQGRGYRPPELCTASLKKRAS